MPRTVHAGIAIDFIAQGLRDGRFPSDVMAHDGTPYRTRSAALKALARLKGRGVRYTSSCPTPLPDSSCPGPCSGSLGENAP